MTIPEALDIAIRHHQAGRLAEAEALYRQILAADPNHFDALHLLGVAAHQVGNHQVALDLIGRAVALNPTNPIVHSNLGAVYRALNRLPEAVAAYRRALELDPAYAEAQHNLADALWSLGLTDDALAAARRALELKPDYAEAYNSVGSVLKEQGELDQSVAAFRHSIRLKPDYAQGHNNLGVAMAESGHLDEAIGAYRRALEVNPDFAEAYNNLGNALVALGEISSGVAALRQAIQLRPLYPDAHNNLAIALGEQGNFDEALTACKRAIELRPDQPGAHSNLGNLLKDSGAIDQAIASFREATRLAPHNPVLQGNLIYALCFVADRNGRIIAEAKADWNRRFGEPVKRFWRPHGNDRNPERRLRVGYVSPDFRQHVVGHNIRPLFQCHDHAHFEIFSYSGVTQPDRMTDLLREHSDEWRRTAGLNDEAVAKLIRADRVDLLVDLSQHGAGNRLPVFARRAAPVRVSFAGYPENTGLEAIEYRISDRWLEADASEMGDGRWEIGRKPDVDLRITNSESEPVPSLAKGSTEQIFLLDSFWCYDPCGMEVTVNELPAKESGRITFGSLNNFAKTNDLVLKLWARVLQEVTGSRLVLLSGFGSHRQRTVEFLELEGIAPSRVEFVAPCRRKDYLELYHRLDIALDPFPYGGHTTSLDALWMGVPVVSLAGERAVSRAGLSILNNLGLPELVTFSENEYVKIAAGLAGDLLRLGELRRTLRLRMENSVLMDAPRFTRQIEAAYRAMWRRWCEQQQ